MRRCSSNKEVVAHLRSVRVPDAFASSLGLCFELTSLEVLFRGLSLEFLQLCPAIFQEFGGKVHAIDFAISYIPRHVVVGRERMRRGEGDRLADSKSTEKLSRFVCPRLQ